MIKVKNIIVPTDFSALSTSAFEYAKDFAETMDAAIHLIHVMEITPPFLNSKNSGIYEEDLLKTARDSAAKRLHEMAEEVQEGSFIKILEVLRLGVDYEEIIGYAKEVSGDMIVIATHGRTGIFHTLLGSVAEKVIRYSKCPVLVISSGEEDI
jgi:nucleotide-binding universal stress UspA family protein